MNTARPCRAHAPIRRDGVGRRLLRIDVAALAGTLMLGGCALGEPRLAEPGAVDGQPDLRELRRVANGVLSTGNANVHVADGVVYVTGNVQTAIDENAVVRALRAVEGVEQVESLLRRGM